MYTKEVFHRSRELKRETRTLPAIVYNLSRTLLYRSGEKALFVPVRSMLYLAVIDLEEIVFLDGAVSRSNIVLAWQNFRARERSALDEPVPYEAVYYTEDSLNIMQRIQSEFQRALRQMDDKEQSESKSGAEIIPLKRR
ncbi:hypothetical protein [Methylocaldum sp.]|uniref:hypothetical protein n=1 Tax=Methylocaldum sp. TaxID=1969727 RepID=UPI002D6FDA5F|nr:hypothetical protein [Methylocaldum sp.]HYE36193.1 hypothetical protein [Methylocaldum sp.]